jgi:hypothetical protein
MVKRFCIIERRQLNHLGATIGHLFVDAFARPNEKSQLCIGAAGRG